MTSASDPRAAKRQQATEGREPSTANLKLLHGEPEFQATISEIRADMAAQLERVREMEASGELEPQVVN